MMGPCVTSWTPTANIIWVNGHSSSQTLQLSSNACASISTALLRTWSIISTTVAYHSIPASSRMYLNNKTCLTDLSHLEHVPTTENYGEYQVTLDHLFCWPYSRATLLQGGLIWHIALLYLDNSVLEVMRGPSLDAALLGMHWVLAGGYTLYDDRLSDTEIDVICGVYKIVTGEWCIIILMLKLIILFRSGTADCPHVLVAKAEYFPQVWTLAQVLFFTFTKIYLYLRK